MVHQGDQRVRAGHSRVLSAAASFQHGRYTHAALWLVPSFPLFFLHLAAQLCTKLVCRAGADAIKEQAELIPVLEAKLALIDEAASIYAVRPALAFYVFHFADPRRDTSNDTFDGE